MSTARDTLLLHCEVAGLPKPVIEHRFHPTRRWRFDIAFVDQMLAVEVDGGVFISGAHVRGAQFEKDREKDAEAMILGWRVLRVTPRQIKEGHALRWIEEILEIPYVVVEP